MVYVAQTEVERRYRTLWVSAELVLDRLLAPHRDGDVIRCVEVEGLPPGCRVDGVCWNDERRCFGYRLWHESFDVIEPGDVIPDIRPMLRVVEVEVGGSPVKFREFI